MGRMRRVSKSEAMRDARVSPSVGLHTDAHEDTSAVNSLKEFPGSQSERSACEGAWHVPHAEAKKPLVTVANAAFIAPVKSDPQPQDRRSDAAGLPLKNADSQPTTAFLPAVRNEVGEIDEYPRAGAAHFDEHPEPPATVAESMEANPGGRKDRVPAPTRVKTEYQEETTQRLNARREFRVPEAWRRGNPPRVEFALGEKTVAVLPNKPQTSIADESRLLDQTTDSAKAAKVPGPRVSMPSPGPTLTATVEEGINVVERAKRHEFFAVSPPSSPAPVREEPRFRVAPRHEPDHSVTVKRIDIQIVNEEPRKQARVARRRPGFEDGVTARLGRHYVREV